MMNESTNDFVTALTKEYIEVEGLPKKDEPLINKDDHFVTEKEKLNEKSKKSEPLKYKQILWNAMSFFDQYFNVKQKDIKERVKKAYIKDKIEKMKFQELDEMGCEVSSNFRKELETLRKTEIVGNNLFSCEKLVKFTEDFKRIEKIIPNSYVLYEIEKNLRMGNDIPYKEIPKLYNDKEAILYTNLIQPDVPEINQNFKLRDLLEDYIEQSSIQAQNALRREDIEFKGFWSTFVCFFLVSANPQTFIYLPIMIYEYGFYFYIYLSVAQFIICYPLIVFVISMSQYSGLGSSRLYSRIKKIWRGIEYVVLLRAFYSILLFVSETQFTTKSIFALGHKIFHEEIYLESCMSREGGCVNLGFIHPCSTGYERDIANNRICRDINQVSMEIYNDKRIKIKTISLNLFIAKFSKELIVFGDDLSEYLTPLIGISLTSILMTLGKTRIIAVVGVFTIPFIIGQTIGLLSLTTNDWQLELNQFCNVEFFPTMPMLFTILKIAIRSVNAVDLLPKISASVPHTIKTPKLALLIILSNILMYTIPTFLYIFASVQFKQLIMKNNVGYGRIRTYEMTNFLPHASLFEILIMNNMRLYHFVLLICYLVHNIFLLSIYMEIFYDHVKTNSMRIYNLFIKIPFLSKLFITFILYVASIFILQSFYSTLFYSTLMLLVPSIDRRILLIQFVLVTYIYGLDKYLSHFREMNGRNAFRDRMFLFYKYFYPFTFLMALLSSGDQEMLKFYTKQYFHDTSVIGGIEVNSKIINIVVFSLIFGYIILQLAIASYNNVYWKTVFRNVDNWGKRDLLFVKTKNQFEED